mmetsp:Transcript_5281/g.11565  ORF Transcript_5281/g.11565 Transcript_5281/m.11565 type:complete len:213 (-) Transcript_5281:126-764(-)
MLHTYSLNITGCLYIHAACSLHDCHVNVFRVKVRTPFEKPVSQSSTMPVCTSPMTWCSSRANIPRCSCLHADGVEHDASHVHELDAVQVTLWDQGVCYVQLLLCTLPLLQLYEGQPSHKVCIAYGRVAWAQHRLPAAPNVQQHVHHLHELQPPHWQLYRVQALHLAVPVLHDTQHRPRQCRAPDLDHLVVARCRLVHVPLALKHLAHVVVAE